MGLFLCSSFVRRFLAASKSAGDPCGNCSPSCLPWWNMPLSSPWKCPLYSAVTFGKRLFGYKHPGPYSYIGRSFFSLYTAILKAVFVGRFAVGLLIHLLIHLLFSLLNVKLSTEGRPAPGSPCRGSCRGWRRFNRLGKEKGRMIRPPPILPRCPQI